jgi:hypothetical protein
MHAPMQHFQNAPAYFATAVSYACKMFMILTPDLLSPLAELKMLDYL